MPDLTTLTLSDLDDHAVAWNDLWRKSDVRLPTKATEGIRLWCEIFSDRAEFKALVVTEGDRFIAALPLVAQKRGPLSVYRLPSNCTVSAGDLLLDPDSDCDAAIERLAEGLSRLPGSLVALEGIEIESDRWQRLMQSLERRGQECYLSQGHDVGVIDILHDWDAYTRSWSRNHRKAMKKTLKKLEAEGEIVVERVRKPADDELQKILERCFEIEDRGWKGEAGTSILKTPKLRDYYLGEARMMRDRGMLDLWLLRLDGEIIAFDYSHLAKGISFSHKISFDPAWEHLSPGKSLNYYQLERYHQDPSCRQVDTLGAMCEQKAKWITRSYKSSRLLVSIGGRWSNLAMRAWKVCNRLRKRLRGVEAESLAIRPGVEKYLQTGEAKPAATVPIPLIAAPVPSLPGSPVGQTHC